MDQGNGWTGVNDVRGLGFRPILTEQSTSDHDRELLGTDGAQNAIKTNDLLYYRL